MNKVAGEFGLTIWSLLSQHLSKASRVLKVDGRDIQGQKLRSWPLVSRPEIFSGAAPLILDCCRVVGAEVRMRFLNVKLLIQVDKRRQAIYWITK